MDEELDIPSMIIGTRKQIIPEMAIQKTMHTSYGDMEIDIPRDRKGEFEPQIVKKYQNTVTRTWKKRSFHVCQRNDYE